MGRIQPQTGCFILTLLGFVTGYPKAVLLKRPNTEKVMGALICIRFERNLDDQNKQLRLELIIKLKLELIAKINTLLHDF